MIQWSALSAKAMDRMNYISWLKFRKFRNPIMHEAYVELSKEWSKYSHIAQYCNMRLSQSIKTLNP